MTVNFAAAALFLSGLVNVSDVSSLYVTFPLGAIFYGLFLISWMLEKEIAIYDAEQREHPGQAEAIDHYGPVRLAHGH